MEREVRIGRLGSGGDGVAEGPDGQLFVPFALPGERVRVAFDYGDKHARVLEVLEPSQDRVAPVCPHFGVCGGCALQHLEMDAYLRWKRELVVAALRSRGLDVEVEAVRPVPPGSRRRATFTLVRTPHGVALGYRAARSHDVIEIETCPVLRPGIVGRLPALKSALASLAPAKGEARVIVTETEHGLDVAVEGPNVSRHDVSRVVAQISELGIARLSVGGDTVARLSAPVIDLSGAAVQLPPGAFLQASREAEAVLVDLVRDGVGKAGRVADLFAGLGTFTFALAKTAAVDAFEIDEASVNALAEAARRTPRLKPVRAVCRDLFRAPLGVRELKAYDAVIFDPPRAGAAAQAATIAASSVRRAIAVSCDPGTLARDLRTLVDGGYHIERVVPVDQFLFSAHIELVAVLTR